MANNESATREIEFRAWDKLEKKYHPQGTVQLTLFGQPFQLGVYGDTIKPNYLDEMIIEQYIGLKDKHGKKIFEGDSFEVTDGDGWVVGEHVAKMDGETLSIDSSCMGEIIGNIHKPLTNKSE